MKLDQIDFGILASLQRDARLSNKDLAGENNISPSTCLERVRRLRSIGALQGFHAEIDPAALGIGVQAMISVRFNQHAQVSFDRLRDEMLGIPEVVALYLLAGSQDVLVHVAVRDVVHLRTLVCDTFMAHADVGHIETALIFEHARRNNLPCYGQSNDTTG